MNAPVSNTITVGLRSDGLVSIMSAPNNPGPVPASNFIMDKTTARWLAREIVRLLQEDTEPHT